MSSITECTSLSRRSSIVFAARRLARSLAKLWIACRNRRDINQLADFNAEMLKDIGLTHSDVSAAIDEPLWRDPSEILISAQQERRSARSAYSGRKDAFIDRL